MLVNVKGIDKEVIINHEVGTTLWSCKVGKALAYWRKGYEYPFVRIPGKSVIIALSCRFIIREYLREYKRIAQQVSKPTPICVSATEEFEINNGSIETKPADPKKIPGLAAWMRDLKLWVECYSRKPETFGQFLYMRRTRLNKNNKEAVEKVEKYSVYCCKCAMRESCTRPCIDPSVSCIQDILTGIESIK